MKNRRILIVYIPILILALMLVVGITVLSGGSFQKGIEEVKIDKQWEKIMADSINQSEIKVSVNGRELTSEDKFYMSDNMELMIPWDSIIEPFDCARNLYNKNKIVIEKGSSKAVLRVGSTRIKFNDNNYELSELVTERDGTIYLPASVFGKYFGYEYVWNSDMNMARFKDESSGDFLPEYYNYADENRDVSTKNQGNYGTCWAFSTLTALETTLMPEEEFDFSENNLVYNNEMSDNIQDGGDYIMSMAYLMAWKGPVLEKDDPYGNGKSYKAENLNSVKHVQRAEIIPEKDYKQIKEKVFKYGGVESSMYMALNNSLSSSVYYNKSEGAYCYKGKKKPNHDVVIVGWDDNYSKELFNDETITNDGAFICKNSWGNQFGFDGIFYISYEDDCIGVNNVCYIEVENTDNYDNIYQSDLCGWTGTMGVESTNQAYFANVYTTEQTENLQAVGFYAVTNNLKYEVFVCGDYKGKNSLNERNHIAASGKITNKGYYTIKLDKDYTVSKGKKFAVIVKVMSSGKNSTFKLIPVEMNVENTKGKVDLTDGEGYFSSKGSNWQSAEKEACNICLKAYTSDK